MAYDNKPKITVTAESKRANGCGYSCATIVEAQVENIPQALILQKALKAYFEGCKHHHNLHEHKTRTFVPAEIDVVIMEEQVD